MLSALLERWHDETNNFHLYVGEMTSTLDHVVCLINIHIKENMMDHEEKISEETGVLLTNPLLGVVEHRAIDECDHQFGDFINIPLLKGIYDEHLNMETQLENVAEREEERNNQSQWCVGAFLLFLVGCTIFTDKVNKHIDLVWLDAM